MSLVYQNLMIQLNGMRGKSESIIYLKPDFLRIVAVSVTIVLVAIIEYTVIADPIVDRTTLIYPPITVNLPLMLI